MEQQNNFSHSQLLLYSSIGATILLLVVVLLTFDKKESSSYKSIKLATGEWAPYSGQNLPEYGKTSAIVTHVLRNMGYQPEFQFMPWSNVESSAAFSESDSGIRGAFPYSDPGDTNQQGAEKGKSERNALFYFSEPLLDIKVGIFYDVRHNPAAGEIRVPADLATHTVISLAGSILPPQFSPFVNSYLDLQYKDNRQALQRLSQPGDSLIFIEDVVVGQRLLQQDYPALMSYIKLAPKSVTRATRLMLAKRNPNNLSLMRVFNRKLAEFKQNKSAYLRFIQLLDNKLEFAMGVELVPLSGEEFVYAFASQDRRHAVLIPKGSRAIVKQWHSNFLNFQPYPIAEQNPLIKVKLLNGPFRSQHKEVYVKAETINIIAAQQNTIN